VIGFVLTDGDKELLKLEGLTLSVHPETADFDFLTTLLSDICSEVRSLGQMRSKEALSGRAVPFSAEIRREPGCKLFVEGRTREEQAVVIAELEKRKQMREERRTRIAEESSVLASCSVE
jgi:hypothetical protein